MILAVAAGFFISSGALRAEEKTSLQETASVESVEGAETINTDKAFEIFEKSGHFLDVRSKELFGKSRVLGAVNMFYKDKAAFNEAAVTAAFPDKTKPVVVYCGAFSCPYCVVGCR